MSITPARLRAFAYVFEYESFSEAARQLGHSVPTVAQLVRSFEKEAQFKLFTTQGRSLVPTSVARTLYPTAVKFLQAEQDAANIVEQYTSFERGLLRVALGNAYPGMDAIQRFQSVFPNVSVQIQNGNWSDVIQMVEDGSVDVGVLPDVPDDGRFDLTLCLHQRVVAVAAPANPLASKRNVTCADLGHEPLIFRTHGSSTQKQVDRGFSAAGVAAEATIVANTRDGVLEAAHRQLGIGFMWEKSSAAHYGLVQLHVEEISIDVGEFVFVKKGRRDPLVSAYIEQVSSLNSPDAMPHKS